MCRVSGVVAAALIAAGWVLCAAQAHADVLDDFDELANPRIEDSEPERADQPDTEERHEEWDALDLDDDDLFGPPQDVAHLHQLDRYLWFAGFDLWRNGGFGHGGMLWAPGGLNREGFRLKLLLAGGLYRYRKDYQQTFGHTQIFVRQNIVGRQELVSVMAGWHFQRDRLSVTVFAGPDLQAHALFPDDPTNRMRGIQTGLRVASDVWYQPFAQVMVSASVSASTIGNSYWLRFASGWHIGGLAWVGPEAISLGGGRYRQLLLGAHITALRFGAFEWTLGAGYVQDTDDRHGYYGRFGITARQ